ncbi:unnamed protein product [Pseudo-nitzschia multistriata]|uniref:Uncharacterized protein n=1 Tax=Pseudo-nitzschia multistriata TaxID=183589 RepID=A0A448YZV5_9STRA|nr:unnamed protein product [Pseudo-nitzschia multistriata]
MSDEMFTTPSGRLEEGGLGPSDAGGFATPEGSLGGAAPNTPYLSEPPASGGLRQGEGSASFGSSWTEGQGGSTRVVLLVLGAFVAVVVAVAAAVRIWKRRKRRRAMEKNRALALSNNLRFYANSECSSQGSISMGLPLARKKGRKQKHSHRRKGSKAAAYRFGTGPTYSVGSSSGDDGWHDERDDDDDDDSADVERGSRHRDWLGGVGYDPNREAEGIDFDSDPSTQHPDDSDAILNNSSSDGGGSSSDDGSAVLQHRNPVRTKPPTDLLSDLPVPSAVEVGPDPLAAGSETEKSTASTARTHSSKSRSRAKARPSSSSSTSKSDLQKEQEALNAMLYELSDELVRQQRELEEAAKAMSKKMTRRKHKECYNHHKKINDEIARLENERRDKKERLRAVQKQIKSQRRERRKKLFSEDYGQ